MCVSDLLSLGYLPGGDDDDLALLPNVHHLGHTVGAARVVDVARGAPRHGGVHHHLTVDAEHVDTSVLGGGRIWGV